MRRICPSHPLPLITSAAQAVLFRCWQITQQLLFKTHKSDASVKICLVLFRGHLLSRRDQPKRLAYRNICKSSSMQVQGCSAGVKLSLLRTWSRCSISIFQLSLLPRLSDSPSATSPCPHRLVPSQLWSPKGHRAPEQIQRWFSDKSRAT